MDVSPQTRRSAPRTTPTERIMVNEFDPDRSGYLRDVSRTGASVQVLPGTPLAQRGIGVGDIFEFMLSGPNGVPCEVVRVFETGYAVAFRREAGLVAA